VIEEKQNSIRRVDVLWMALVAYVPFFLSSPGKISGDTKQYLYLDPGRLLARAPYLWHAHMGTGTVPHQNIGYLFPMGPYYWLMDQIGLPDWIAQRIWMGSISFVAVVGALWLFTLLGTGRLGAVVGALVYMFTPYQLAFTARISVLLLAWAALPWLVGLTAKSLHRGGWRCPALFALVALPCASISAPTFFLVLVAPALWLALAAIRGPAPLRTVVMVAFRIGLLTLGVSLWWIAGLVLQARYGFSVLEGTESLAQVSGSSLPADILRGFGNWFLSGSDRLGSWLEQAAEYGTEKWLTIITLAVPVLALTAAAVTRWRHRSYFALLIVVGTIIGAGAWPYENPSLVGRLFRDLSDSSAVGLALRNTPRVGPVVVLGIAGLLAAGVSALSRRRVWQLAGAGLVVFLVVAGFAPVWQHGYLAQGIERPEAIPRYWQQATAALDAQGDDTRVLEIPGSLFSAYRWGNAVEPITPGLIDRPFVARELLAYGTAGSVNLLAALDRRLQNRTFEPSALAATARLLATGTIAVRSDLQTKRYDVPNPDRVWNWLTNPLAPGLASPTGYGKAGYGKADYGKGDPPPVALFDVLNPRSIISTASPQGSVIVSGDGDGIVESAAAGLIDGNELIFYSVSLSRNELKRAVADNAALVITDTNRRRARYWDSLRNDHGPTETKSGGIANVNDKRVDTIPGTTADDQTTVEGSFVSVPTKLLRNASGQGIENSVAIVLARVREDPLNSKIVSEELTISRSLTLPIARSYSLAGTARINNASGLGVTDSCRDDLVRIDGQPVAMKISPQPSDTGGGYSLLGCTDSITLSRGRHEITTQTGSATGLDIDRLVLTSAPGGRAAINLVAKVGAPPPTSAAKVKVLETGSASAEIRITTNGDPFWLVLGQSQSDGWHAVAAGRDLGPSQLVNGYANGWLVKPVGPGAFIVSLKWTPQNLVWWGIGLSIAAIIACLGLVIFSRRRSTNTVLADAPTLTGAWFYAEGPPNLRIAVLGAVGMGVGAALVSRPWIGAVVAIAVIAASRIATGRLLLTAGAPLVLVVSKAASVPELGWLAVLLLAGDLVAGWLRRPGNELRKGP